MEELGNTRGPSLRSDNLQRWSILFVGGCIFQLALKVGV
jgi:hypothetical protein